MAETRHRSAEMGPTAAHPSAGADAPADYDLRALAVYGLLTLVIIVALWLVMRSLSRQPILVRSAGLGFGDDWVSITDSDLLYTLNLPTDWQWLDVPFRDQAELLPKVVSEQPYIDQALRPLAGEADDIRLLAVAVGVQVLENSEPAPLVVIAQSDRLRTMTPQQALDRLENQPLPVSETSIDTHLAGQPQARFNALDLANSYQCRHLFVADADRAGYLVAACAPQSRFSTLQKDLKAILDSFQLLEH